MSSRAETIQQNHEPRPDPQALTSNPDPAQNSSTDVDYEPHPDQSIKVSPQREKAVKAITSLYSGSASEEDMQVYAQEAVYDDPWSYCDTRYKIAGQWYGMQLSPSNYPLLKPTAADDAHRRDRHTKSHGVLKNPRHRDRLQYRHPARIQNETRIHTTTPAFLETSQQPCHIDIR